MNGYKSTNGNMHCVSIDFIVMFIMVIIYIIYLVYPLKNYLLFQEMILLYHFIQIIIILIVYSMVLYNYYNQTMELFTYCIIFMIVGFGVSYWIDLYQLIGMGFIHGIILFNVLSYDAIIIDEDDYTNNSLPIQGII